MTEEKNEITVFKGLQIPRTDLFWTQFLRSFLMVMELFFLFCYINLSWTDILQTAKQWIYSFLILFQSWVKRKILLSDLSKTEWRNEREN